MATCDIINDSLTASIETLSETLSDSIIFKPKIKVKKIIPDYRILANEHLSSITYLTPVDIENIESKLYDYAMTLANKNGHTNTSRIFKNIYTNKLMHIMANIDPDSYVKNEYLISKLKSKEIEAGTIVFMQPRDMAPEKWEFYNNTEYATVTAVTEGDLSLAKTTLFTCSRCKKNECVYYQMQTRSCDEGTTNFITCLNCKKHWRQFN